MRVPATIVLLIATATWMPPVSAQSITGFELDIPAPTAPLPHDQSTHIPYTLIVGCSELLQAGGTETVTLTHDAPPWMTITGDLEQTFAALECTTPITRGRVDKTGTLNLTPQADAPGLAPTTLTLTATRTSNDATTPATLPFTIAYAVNLNISLATEHPIQVRSKQTPIPIHIQLQTNAPTNVALQLLGPPQVGTLDVPATVNLTNQTPGTPATTTLDLIFRDGSDSWKSQQITLKATSQVPGQPEWDGQGIVYAWTLERNTTRGSSGDDSGGGPAKETPSPQLLLPILALIAILKTRSRGRRT